MTRGSLGTSQARIRRQIVAAVTDEEAAVGDTAQIAALRSAVSALNQAATAAATEAAAAASTAEAAASTAAAAHQLATDDTRIVGVEQKFSDLAALATDYLSQLTSSIADRAGLHRTDEGLLQADTLLASQLASLLVDLTAVRQKNLDQDQVDKALQTVIARMPAFGTAATPLLALAQVRTLTVDLSWPMPNLNYTARAFVDPTLAGKLNAAVTLPPTKTDQVTVTTTALLAVGAGSLTVVAWPTR